MSVWFVLVFTVCVTCGSVNKTVCISVFGSSLQWEWEYVLRRSVVSARVCERASVFSSCWYMCTTFVSPYLLSSVCFKWHKCIVKRRTYLRGADKQPNTNRFFSGYQGRLIVVILNTTQGTWHWKAHFMRMTRDNCVFHCECLSLAISSLPLNLKWGTGRRSSYSIQIHFKSCLFFCFFVFCFSMLYKDTLKWTVCARPPCFLIFLIIFFYQYSPRVHVNL